MPKNRIMIIEDEVLIGMALRAELRHLGYDICQIYASGEEALANIGREKPDIILLDMSLEGELSGLETGRRIKDAFQTPLIFLTGYPDNKLMHEAQTLEPIGYFVKPVRIGDLQKTIAAFFENKNPT